MGIREIKEAARRALHEAMKVPAYYFAPGSVVPITCTIRVHTRFTALGDIQSNQVGLAEKEEIVPRLLFLDDEVDPARGGMVTVSGTEGYRIDATQPPDGITITAFVVSLTVSQIAGYPWPGDV